MKYSMKSVAVVAAVAAGLSLSACSSDDDDSTDGTTSAAPTTQTTALPTAVELNDVLNRAVDPAVPSDQKADTVEGGDQALELFDVMTQSKEESGATLEVVDPVLPGILPDTDRQLPHPGPRPDARIRGGVHPRERHLEAQA